MTAGKNPEDPNHPDKKSRLPSKASLSQEGLEFNFGGSPQPARFEKSTIPTDPEMLHDLQSGPARESEEARRSGAANRLSFAGHENKFHRPEPTPEKTSTHSNTMPTLSPSPNPTISDFRKNADRQRREQRSVTTLVSGVAYALIGGIILVAGLAGFGGYVLWKQIQDQAVTVAQVNAKLDGEVALIKGDLEHLKKFATDQAAFDIEVKEKLGKIAASTDRIAAGVREEREARAREISALQKRVTRVENRRPSMGPGE
jgi:hypothetical protein